MLDQIGKKNLLTKANQFNLYEKLIQHDSNKKFPFEDETFETIFSNTFYWLNDIESILKYDYYKNSTQRLTHMVW